MKAGVDSNGAVILGEYVSCDAHADRKYRVVTHAHADHLLGLKKSIKGCEGLIMTPATIEILRVLKGDIFPEEKLIPLDYQRPFEVAGEKLSLHDAGHILGSAQVLLENSEGLRIAYTGDFRLPKAEILSADVLIIESTYGNPDHERPFKTSVEEELVNLVKSSLDKRGVHIFGYYGKLQEAVALLRDAGIEEPAVMPRRIYRIAEICERYGMNMGEYLLEDSEEGMELLAGRGGCIGLHHLSARRKFNGYGARIYLTGWEFNAAVRQISENEHLVAFSSHSDFKELLEYVEEGKPRVVITDNYRVSSAPILAGEITKRLGIPAYPMP